jgi:predicted NAD/FAD-dependent oxidoreductase
MLLKDRGYLFLFAPSLLPMQRCYKTSAHHVRVFLPAVLRQHMHRVAELQKVVKFGIMGTRILIVGAGITGAAVYRFLRTLMPHTNAVVSVWEAQRSAGGRMASDYFSSVHRCDLGAQYISRAIVDKDECAEVYDYLVDAGALQLLPNNNVIHGMRPEHTTGRHYIAPQGTASIVSSLLQGAMIYTGTELRDLQVDAERGTVTATKTTGASEEFDVVVMATTTPSVLSVLDSPEKGDSASSGILSAEVLKRLRSVTYSSR